MKVLDDTIHHHFKQCVGCQHFAHCRSCITSETRYDVDIRAETKVTALNTPGMMGIKRTHDILNAVFGIPISTSTIFSMVKECVQN